MIRVCIVDDQRLMREGLRQLIDLESDMRVDVLAGNGEEALAALEKHDVDVVLMDIRMPIKNGIVATGEMKQRWPYVKVLMLTTYEDKDDVVGALSAGAVGYLLKDMPAEDIAAAIRTAQAGGAVLPPGIANTFLEAVQEQSKPAGTNVPTNTLAPVKQIMDQELGNDNPKETNLFRQREDVGLTERETDVLHCLAEGLSNREIAERLFVTEGTVKNHVSNLIGKLGLRDRTQVALHAVRHGYGEYTDKV